MFFVVFLFQSEISRAIGKLVNTSVKYQLADTYNNLMINYTLDMDVLDVSMH